MITIITTVGELAPERRAPFLAAFKHNLSISCVDNIYVVSEAPSQESMQWIYDAVEENKKRIVVKFVADRPTFADLFCLANQLLDSGSDTMAIMNADISIGSADDAKRILGVLSTLGGRHASTVLALTRHEQNGQLALYEPTGLPNALSSDAWFFQCPIQVKNKLFYSLGQMNCDMLLAYDLLASGYQLVNPCLDVQILHHEPSKEYQFYEEKNESQENQERLWDHVKINKIATWNYYGVPWVRSCWVELGYIPGPVSTNGSRLIVALPAGAEHCLPSIILNIDQLILSHDLEVHILYDGDTDFLVRSYIDIFSTRKNICAAKPRIDSRATLREFLLGKQHYFDAVAFVNDISKVDDALLSVFQMVWVDLSQEPISPVPEYGCSLVTSLFRAEAFLQGFTQNISTLVGYNTLIEHIFLFSALSYVEASLLLAHFTAYRNCVLFWFRKDPGLYECWNTGIRFARTEYVSNANVDDLRHPDHVISLLQTLEEHPEAVVAATALVPFYDYPSGGALPSITEVWYANQAGKFAFPDIAKVKDGPASGLVPHNIPHCMPVWRRSLHNRVGWFDEPQFGTYADWAFWLRVLEGDNVGWLRPEPLGFYFVNPSSHNRRGSQLEDFHRAIEKIFTPRIFSRLAGWLPIPHPMSGETPRKLHLFGLKHSYGQHRNSFNSLISALEPLNQGEGGIRFVPFLERQFVWGDNAADGEAASTSPQPIVEPWIGILHVPFETPDWFEPKINPQHFFATELFQKSLPACRGLLTLSADLQNDLNTYLPGLASLSLKHPTNYDVQMWEPQKYQASPCVVQVGDWLRKLQGGHRLRAPGHRKLMLLKRYTREYLRREIEIFGDSIDPDVEMLDFVSNEKYDAILSQSIVLCLMYATAANNILIECIVRGTPVITNPLPGAVEYLGVGYPLYAKDEIEASAILQQPGRIAKAHAYLLQRRSEIDLSYQGFCSSLSISTFYRNL